MFCRSWGQVTPSRVVKLLDGQLKSTLSEESDFVVDEVEVCRQLTVVNGGIDPVQSVE